MDWTTIFTALAVSAIAFEIRMFFHQRRAVEMIASFGISSAVVIDQTLKALKAKGIDIEDTVLTGTEKRLKEVTNNGTE